MPGYCLKSRLVSRRLSGGGSSDNPGSPLKDPRVGVLSGKSISPMPDHASPKILPPLTYCKCDAIGDQMAMASNAARDIFKNIMLLLIQDEEIKA